MTAVAAQTRPRLGFLGTGWIGRHRLEAIAASDVAHVAALADPDGECLSAAARAAPGAALLAGGLCLLYTSPSPRDRQKSRMPSSA